MLLAIDPGSMLSGWATLCAGSRGPELVDAGKWRNEDLRDWLVDRRHGPPLDGVAFEGMQSYGKPVGKTVFDTVLWLGRFVECTFQCRLPLHVYYRPEIFRGLTGATRGGDRVLHRVLRLRFGDALVDRLQVKGGGSDARAAFALGVYHLDLVRLGGA